MNNEMKRQAAGKSVAFTGHRHLDDAAVERVEKRLIEYIIDLYHEGYDTFYCGMAMGFDLLAAECVVHVRQHCGFSLRLVACIPFPGQEKRYTEVDRFRYDTLLQTAEDKIYISGKYSRYSYLRRNDYMLEHADKVIAWHDPSLTKGGTAYTVRRAIEMKKDVANLF